MKVKELKELLAQCDDNDDVLLSRDAEGNGYHLLDEDGVSINTYNWNGEWDAEIGHRQLTKELIKQGYTEEDLLEGSPCIVLWPS